MDDQAKRSQELSRQAVARLKARFPDLAHLFKVGEPDPALRPGEVTTLGFIRLSGDATTKSRQPSPAPTAPQAQATPVPPAPQAQAATPGPVVGRKPVVRP